MKKQYQSPVIKEHKIRMSVILAGSLSVKSTEKEGANGWGSAQSKGYYYLDDEDI